MNAPAIAFPSHWQVSIRLAVDGAGGPILSRDRLELLESIARCRSISAAARERGISYRHAWLMVQGMNDGAGEPLVISATGGHHGGGARLTGLGEWTCAYFRQLQDELQQTASARLRHAAAAGTAETIHVAAAVCLEEVLGQLLTDFRQRRPECRVRAVFGGSDELAEHVIAGAPTDLFIAADLEPLDRLARAGLIQHQARTVLAETTLAAIGAAERDLPVRAPADLARLASARVALADPTCPLGRYTHDYLRGLKLTERLKGRIVYVENSRAVGAAVRGGSADVGLAYASDLHRSPDCRLLFRVKKTPSPIRFSAAVVGDGPRAEQGRTLLDFLASGTSAERFRRCGFSSAH
ncbi:MAG: molybdate ABC transporter substrate-binding protein [Planctomycetia bacterium]|nr:molybdate ABC transporter substrate-binding protein [Planctomycetia bacterium]